MHRGKEKRRLELFGESIYSVCTQACDNVAATGAVGVRAAAGKGDGGQDRERNTGKRKCKVGEDISLHSRGQGRGGMGQEEAEASRRRHASMFVGSALISRMKGLSCSLFCRPNSTVISKGGLCPAGQHDHQGRGGFGGGSCSTWLRGQTCRGSLGPLQQLTVVAVDTLLSF